MKENIEYDEVEFEPCELEDFEDNPDADENIVDVSEEEYDEIVREQERKERRKERISAFLRVILNIIISIFVIWIVWYFSK